MQKMVRSLTEEVKTYSPFKPVLFLFSYKPHGLYLDLLDSKEMIMLYHLFLTTQSISGA